MSETRITAYSARELREGEEPLDLSNPPIGVRGWGMPVKTQIGQYADTGCEDFDAALAWLAEHDRPLGLLGQRVYHKCDTMPPYCWDIVCGPSDLYPDDYKPGEWWFEMNEYHAVIKFCPYCGEELTKPPSAT